MKSEVSLNITSDPRWGKKNTMSIIGPLILMHVQLVLILLCKIVECNS